ncbi:MAG TPA: class I SAM-dependent methyltransferase, partial [Polyangiales bacterium]|nr:class I SAM-dependent methyltransferase [Polyangiales bacterium]
AEHSVTGLLGAQRVDLAFIDGMHRFENALLDFINVESWSHPGATIVFHDCVPLIARTARRERETSFWVGDTWKVVLALTRHRPDLKLRTLLTPPSGLVVVRRTNPTSQLLRTNFASIVADLAELEWQHAPGRLPAEFSAIPSTDAGVAEALA